jgi:excinuclease ABC subunit C
MPRLVSEKRQLLALGRPSTTDEQVALMRGLVKADARDLPGVYRWLAPDGEVVYIGKSKRVRSRLLSYFRCGPDDKGARIVRAAHAIEWEYQPSEFAALLAELRMIKRFRPRYNVQLKRDARHYSFIKVTRGPASKLLVVRGAGSEDGGTYFGPYMGAHRIGEAVRELNDALGLRDCAQDVRMVFADQQELFQIAPRTPGCIRFEVRKCLGPCVAACSVKDYEGQLALARAFLEGTGDEPMDTLRAKMEAAAEGLEFERAAYYRDKLQRLEGLREQFGRLRFAVEKLSFGYRVPGAEGDDRLYLIRRGRVRAECAAPRTAAERRAAQQLARDVFTPPERDTAQVATHEIDELLLLSSWFRRFPEELDQTQPPDALMGRALSRSA